MHTTRLTRLIISCVAALAALTASAHAGQMPATQPGDPLDPRTYAPESTPFLAVHASGTL